MTSARACLLSWVWLGTLLGCSDGGGTTPPVDAGDPADVVKVVDAGCAETNPEFCARLSASCGSVSSLDACGRARTVTCGTCTESMQCSATYQCVAFARWQRVGGTSTTSNYEGVAGVGADTYAVLGFGLVNRLGPTVNDQMQATSVPPGANGLFARGSTFYAFGDAFVIGFTGDSGARVGNIVGEVKALGGSGPDDLWASMLTGGLRHWDGRIWEYNDTTGLPFDANSDIRGLFSFTARDAWAVGTNGAAFHWSGTAWTRTPTGFNNVTWLGVWGAAPNDVWAVGGISGLLSRTTGNLIHYTGGRWTEPFEESITALRAIHGISASNIWAVGDRGLILHYNGTRWMNESFANTSVDFYAVWARAADDVWAVGSGGVIAHYGL